MLGLFGSRIAAEPEFISELKAVETEDRLRAGLAGMLANADLEIRDTNSPTEFTAETTVVIMKLVLQSSDLEFEDLSFENRFVTGLFGFLIAHNLCRKTHADLGVVLAIAGLDLFTREEIDQIYKLGSSYRRLRQHRQMHLALREIIDRFLSHPDAETLADLSGVYQLCLRQEG